MDSYTHDTFVLIDRGDTVEVALAGESFDEEPLWELAHKMWPEEKEPGHDPVLMIGVRPSRFKPDIRGEWRVWSKADYGEALKEEADEAFAANYDPAVDGPDEED